MQSDYSKVIGVCEVINWYKMKLRWKLVKDSKHVSSEVGLFNTQEEEVRFCSRTLERRALPAALRRWRCRRASAPRRTQVMSGRFSGSGLMHVFAPACRSCGEENTTCFRTTPGGEVQEHACNTCLPECTCAGKYLTGSMCDRCQWL